MATRTLVNLAVLLLAISQLVHIATPRELLPRANPMTASSLLVTSISGESPSSGFKVSHGRGATEEKVLLDAPNNIPVPANPTTASSLVAITGFALPPGYGDNHGATEEKVLLDAPRNIPVPSSPPLQGK